MASEVDRFRETAEYIKAEMETAAQPDLFPTPELVEPVISSPCRSIGDDSILPVHLRKFDEDTRIVAGFLDIYERLWDQTGFGKTMRHLFCCLFRQAGLRFIIEIIFITVQTMYFLE